MVRSRVLDANLFVLLLSPANASQQLVLDIVGELKADRVVSVAELFTDVARVGPRRLGARLRGGAALMRVVAVVRVVVMSVV